MRAAAGTAALLALALAGGALGCGGTRTTAVATAPASADAPATGTLRVFAYEDSVDEEMLAPFKAANPDVTVKTATFDSNEEAAAKLRGGFEADVVEVCLDEIRPLTATGQLRPLEEAGIPGFERIVPSMRDADGVRDAEGRLMVVPLEAGPEGLIYNTEKLPRGIDEFADLYDPALAGNVALEGDIPLPTIAETALALGIRDPLTLSDAQLDRVMAHIAEHRDGIRAFWQSDADAVNLMKSGEVIAMNGGRGLAFQLREAGVPVRWVRAREGLITWVCGFGIASSAKNVPAAYKLVNYLLSKPAQALRARNGYVVTTPDALSLVGPEVRRTADPAVLEGAIAEEEPQDYDRWTRAWARLQAG
ncbi:extracellular solute-binding protein [Conexibacter stalactiti]|uniref:Extracellular solute-binding protein n=1 Tax=Conexibacter stalactiti TaxID=1940611 RepID=A0ABU4HR12_9ACTN|nr:extracellular solute-binding protein [Conexibacter stalactiti]MDW5595735.1 extracellular solute-binding protein [Conexibacter stalactiti]MEC5036377.1 extracellular solute-binding protein [Conexibacter stalactiti]